MLRVSMRGFPLRPLSRHLMPVSSFHTARWTALLRLSVPAYLSISADTSAQSAAPYISGSSIHPSSASLSGSQSVLSILLSFPLSLYGLVCLPRFIRKPSLCERFSIYPLGGVFWGRGGASFRWSGRSGLRLERYYSEGYIRYRMAFKAFAFATSILHHSHLVRIPNVTVLC